MGKTKTSNKQKKSTKNTPNRIKKKRMINEPKNRKLKANMGLIEYSPTEELLNEEFIALAVWECLKNNDPEGVVEIIEAHLNVVNKARAAKEALLPRSSLYNALRGKNPTVKTLAKLVHCCG